MLIRDKINAGALAIAKTLGFRVPDGHDFSAVSRGRDRDYWQASMAAWEAFHGDSPDLDAEADEDDAAALDRAVDAAQALFQVNNDEPISLKRLRQVNPMLSEDDVQTLLGMKVGESHAFTPPAGGAPLTPVSARVRRTR